MKTCSWSGQRTRQDTRPDCFMNLAKDRRSLSNAETAALHLCATIFSIFVFIFSCPRGCCGASPHSSQASAGAEHPSLQGRSKLCSLSLFCLLDLRHGFQGVHLCSAAECVPGEKTHLLALVSKKHSRSTSMHLNYVQMHLYVRVCVYVCVRICVYPHTHILYLPTYLPTYLSISIYLSIYRSIHLSVNLSLYVHVNIFKYTYMYNIERQRERERYIYIYTHTLRSRLQTGSPMNNKALGFHSWLFFPP